MAEEKTHGCMKPRTDLDQHNQSEITHEAKYTTRNIPKRVT